MKLNKFTKGAIAFSVLSMLASGALVASAATDNSTASSTGNGLSKGHGRGIGQEQRIKPEDMTDAQKAEMEAKKAEMDAKFEAVKTAIAANNYNAWATAEKAINENSPMLSKITADNFSKYVEAYNLRAQADAIMKDLGIDGMGMGFGPGRGMGMGKGLGHEAPAQE